MSERWPGFDIVRDNELIAAGTHFWCSGCLVARPVDDQSTDPRYCQNCFELLKQEAALLPKRAGKPFWVPKNGGKKMQTIRRDGRGILSTSNDKKITVDKNTPQPRIYRGLLKGQGRGRKSIDLPMDIINNFASQGLGSKAIAARLLEEHGIAVNYRTIARRKLQGVLI